MKSITIFWIIFLTTCLFIVGYNEQKNKVDLGNIEISSSSLNILSDAVPDNYAYRVCSLKKEDGDNPCVTLLKRKLE